MERQTIAANFWVAPSKVRRNGLAPINVTITRNGKRASFSTGRMIRPDNWDSKRQRAKGKSEEATAINTHLQQISIQLQQKEDDLISKGYIITADLLRDAMLGKIDSLQTKTLMQLFEDFLSDRRRDVECGKIAKDTFENNNRSANYVREFIRSRYKRSDVALHELNHSFISNFDTFLRKDKGMKKNTSVKSLRTLKQVIGIAIANGHIKADPFTKFKIQREVVERDFLTNEELQRIINHDFEAERLQRVRDIFIFACFTGLSYIDLRTLEPQHIIKDENGRMWIKKRRKKTGILFRVPLLPIPKLILEKYRGNEQLLPILNIGTTDEYLKEIAALCGIEKRISSHTARYTFATTVTLTNRVSLEVVAKMMGHTNTRMTSHYANVVDEYIGAEMDKLGSIYHPSEA